MKLSVAMATCNGHKYIQAQLDSLVAQTRRPDEMVISDDASTDGTAGLIARFAAEAPFPVVVRDNPTRLGYIKNFEQAVSLCSGEVIFLADQDDLWRPEKLARHEAIYQARTDVGGVFSDAAVVDQDLQPLGFGLWQHMGLKPSKVAKFRTGRGLDLFIKRGSCYGILLSFRARFRDILIPFPLNFSHDDWISLVLSAVAQLELIADPLVDYRQHGAQAVGVGAVAKTPTATAAASPPGEDHYGVNLALQRLATFEERMSHFPDRLLRRDWARVIRGRRAYLQRRGAMARRHPLARLVLMARNLVSGDYLRYATFPKSELLADLRGN